MGPFISGTQTSESPAQETAGADSSTESFTDNAAEQDAGKTIVQRQDGQAPPLASAEETGETGSWEPGLPVLALLCPADVAGQDLEFDLTGKCPDPAAGLSLDIITDGEPTGTYVANDRGVVDLPATAGPHQLQISLPAGPGSTRIEGGLRLCV